MFSLVPPFSTPFPTPVSTCPQKISRLSSDAGPLNGTARRRMPAPMRVRAGQGR
jgi:hypothetical protein